MLFLKEKDGLGEKIMFGEGKEKKVGWYFGGKCIDSAITQFGQRSIELISHGGSLFQTSAVSLSNTYSFPFKPLQFPF